MRGDLRSQSRPLVDAAAQLRFTMPSTVLSQHCYNVYAILRLPHETRYAEYMRLARCGGAAVADGKCLRSVVRNMQAVIGTY
jgi:hypothetical protein